MHQINMKLIFYLLNFLYFIFQYIPSFKSKYKKNVISRCFTLLALFTSSAIKTSGNIYLSRFIFILIIDLHPILFLCDTKFQRITKFRLQKFVSQIIFRVENIGNLYVFSKIITLIDTFLRTCVQCYSGQKKSI